MCFARSPNGVNRLSFLAEPLEKRLAHDITTGRVQRGRNRASEEADAEREWQRRQRQRRKTLDHEEQGGRNGTSINYEDDADEGEEYHDDDEVEDEDEEGEGRGGGGGMISSSVAAAAANKATETFLREEHGWDVLAARSVWAFGPADSVTTAPVVLLDETLQGERDPAALEESKSSIIQGFQWGCREGPLCDEKVQGVKFRLLDVTLAAAGLQVIER